MTRTWQVARLDPLVRLIYRLGYPVARLWWFVRRPPHQGVVVAVWHAGRLLLIDNSYRVRPSLPGGGIGRGETPEQAARRELREELGLILAEGALSLAFEMETLWEFRLDHVRVFEVTLAEPPALALDNREVVAARFVAPEHAAALPLPPFVRAYLDRALAARLR